MDRPEMPSEERDTTVLATGTLLGTAVGDALGLPAERMSAEAIRRRWRTIDRFRLLGSTGFVSDDTEQAALVAAALARFPDDPERCARAFQRSLVGWFFRLPFGVGLATIRACCRAAVGLRDSGVPSAGNGAAMRAAIVGVVLRSDPKARRAFGEALAGVTHTDRRAVEGALFTAELAALCADRPYDTPGELVRQAMGTVSQAELLEALARSMVLAAAPADLGEAAAALGTSGYVVHTVAFAAYCFATMGDRPRDALIAAVGAGGDTDSIGAILGAWLGARHGAAGLPGDLVERIHDGPFGPSHLRALARSLGERTAPPGYSALGALARNLALYPVILAHGLRRLAP